MEFEKYVSPWWDKIIVTFVGQECMYSMKSWAGIEVEGVEVVF